MESDPTDANPVRTPKARAEAPVRAGPLRVARAVLWSFFGVRRGAAYEADIASITPLQAIVGGLIGALLLVAGLIALVMFITR